MSYETMGVQRVKTTPVLFFVDYGAFQPAIDWVSRHLRTLGHEPTQASLDPYMVMWHFTNAHGEFVAKVPHDLMERILEALFAYNQMVDSKQPALIGRSS